MSNTTRRYDSDVIGSPRLYAGRCDYTSARVYNTLLLLLIFILVMMANESEHQRSSE